MYGTMKRVQCVVRNATLTVCNVLCLVLNCQQLYLPTTFLATQVYIPVSTMVTGGEGVMCSLYCSVVHCSVVQCSVVQSSK